MVEVVCDLALDLDDKGNSFARDLHRIRQNKPSSSQLQVRQSKRNNEVRAPIPNSGTGYIVHVARQITSPFTNLWALDSCR